MSDTLTGKTVLVTGATGFIARHLVNALRAHNTKILALARNPAKVASLSTNDQVVGVVRDLTQAGSLADVLRDVDVVFHLASEGEGGDAAQELRSSTEKQTDEKAKAKESQEGVTVRGTRKLLDAAVKTGVKRFVFFSSVKAFGETTDARLDETSDTHPTSAYGRAKLAAENLALETGLRHELHVCILRLPLVYGLDNKGNIPRMIAAIDRGRFPPLPEVGNKRSMVHVSDVVQAALLAAENPAAAGQLYIVTDGQVYSTRDLYVKICQGLDRRIAGWHLPLGLWRGLAKVGDLIGAIQGRPFAFDSEALQKLFGSAWFSSEKITRELGYRPTRTLDDGIKEMVAVYKGPRTEGKGVRRED
jgi:nucleoside-diphosphate-sugar epimerase